MTETDTKTEWARAVDSLPNANRYAKGDIVVAGPHGIPYVDEPSDRRRLVMARARSSTLRIILLHRAQVLDDDQLQACMRFRRYWEAAVQPYGAHIVDYNAVRLNGILSATTPARLDDSLRYAYLCHDKQGIDRASNHILHDIVCYEKTVKQSMRGDDHTKTDRFIKAIGLLGSALQSMDMYENI